jgi:hypothetical protein
MSAKVTEAMVEAGAGPILDILNTAALAFPTDPAAKHLAKRLARAAIAAALSTEPGEAEGAWVADREMLAEAAEDPSLSDGAVRALCLARQGRITPEIRQWAQENLAAAPLPEDTHHGR